MKRVFQTIDRKTALLLAVCFVLSLVFLLFASPYTTPLNDYYGYDSAVFMTLGKGVAEGKLPYADLYDNKGPMIFYIDALGWLLGGRTGVFAVQVVFMAFALLLIYKLARLWVNIPRSWLGLLVFAFFYCGTVGEGNMTEEYCLVFSLLPLYLAFRHLESSREAGRHPCVYSLIYGFCFGAEIMFRVTNACLVGGIVLAFAILLCREKAWKALAANALLFLMGALLAVLPFAVYFKLIGAYDSFIYASFLHNFHYAADGAQTKTALDWLYWLARISLIPIAAVLCFVFDKAHKIQPGSKLLLFCSGVLGAVAMTFGYGYKHYFLILAPILVAAYAISTKIVLLGETEERGKRPLLAFVLLIVTVLPYAPQSAIHAGKSIMFNFQHYYDDQVAAYREMNSYITEDRDSVLGLDVNANLYCYLDVTPCFRHFVDQTWSAKSSPFITEEIDELLRTDPPKWLIASRNCIDRYTEDYGYDFVVTPPNIGGLTLFHYPGYAEIEGKSVRLDVTDLTLETDVLEDIASTIDGIPTLCEVTLNGGVSVDTQKELLRRYPGITFHWKVQLLGETYPTDTDSLSYRGRVITEDDLAEISEALPLLPAVAGIDLCDTGLPFEVCTAFADAHPGLTVGWNTELFGVTIRSTDEVITFDDIPLTIEDAAQIEALLPYMPNLTTVEMLRCGISNEDMDALNKRHEDVRFVWMVQVFNCGVRTDSTFFCYYSTEYYYDSNNQHCQFLRYCPDIIAFDLGHYKLFGEEKTEFLSYLPHLRYAVLSNIAYEEVPELADLHELEFLEIFWSSFNDLTPLLQCENLKHLNITCTRVRNSEADIEVLCQMKQLKRLWFSSNMYSDEQVARLREALPDTQIEIIYDLNCVSKGWREGDKAYFDMRDALHMYYMSDNSDHIFINPYTGEESLYNDTDPFPLG